MTSISGKTSLDWAAFASELAPIEIISKPVQVKRLSRDFFWFSPILNEKLGKCYGDLVALPSTVEELSQCLATAYKYDAPVVIRGGGTGNYGQAVPLEGGLIIDTTNMNKIIEIGEDYIRVEAGAKMFDLNEALKPHGRELVLFPSTQKLATIGGFVGGGSTGIGSVSNGMLRDPGNIREIRALSVEETPREVIFTGGDINNVQHAWGLNGVITEVTLRTVPTENWISCVAGFPDYTSAYGCGYDLSKAKEIGPKLVSTVDARIATYFPELKDIVEPERDLLVALVPDHGVDAYKALMESWGGKVYMTMTEDELAENNLPHVHEFSYNHTTLQVLKSDRSVTYLQVGCPTPPDKDRVGALHGELGEEAWMHHEYALLNGEIVTFDLPIIWYKSEEQMRAIEAKYEAAGFKVFDAHTFYVEGGGLKNVDYRHLAWKKRLDPKGLLNSPKSAFWSKVKDMDADAIETAAQEA